MRSADSRVMPATRKRELLRLALRERAALAEQMHGTIDGVVELIGRDALVQKPDARGGRRIEHFAADETDAAPAARRSPR